MIVKNEAHNLARCLDSVAGLASDIVIVDTGSSDETLEIAASRDARIFHFDFGAQDFAAARNYSLDYATGKFVLVLDADETLDPRSVTRVRDLARRNDDAGYIVQRRNLERANDGSAATVFMIDHAVRFFPNRSRYRYRGRVHETVDASILEGGGHIRRSDIFLDHHLPSTSALREKSLRYIALLEDDLRVFPADPERLTFLAAEYHKLGMLDEATRIAEAIAMLTPNDATAHVNVGLYHLVHLRDAPRAKRDFERALRLRPDSREAREGLRAIRASNA